MKINLHPAALSLLGKMGTYKKVKNFLKEWGFSSSEQSEIVHQVKSQGWEIK
jgi:hypothetical protein